MVTFIFFCIGIVVSYFSFRITKPKVRETIGLYKPTFKIPNKLVAWHSYSDSDYHLRFFHEEKLINIRGGGAVWYWYPEGTRCPDYIECQAVIYCFQIKWKEPDVLQLEHKVPIK